MHVFISYKRNDPKLTEFFEFLELKLKDKGFEYWNDRHIVPGENWETEIDNAIRECFAFLLLVTQEATKSQYITYEWSTALARDKDVIPILLDSEAKLHPKLERTQYLDFSDPGNRDWQSLFDLLAKIRDELVGSSRIHSSSLKNEIKISSALHKLYDNHKHSFVETEDMLGVLRELGFISSGNFALLSDKIIENRNHVRRLEKEAEQDEHSEQ